VGISLRYEWKQIKEAWYEGSRMLQHFVFRDGIHGTHRSGAGFKFTADGSLAKGRASEFCLSSNQLFS
jgi:hypothetical protein